MLLLSMWKMSVQVYSHLPLSEGQLVSKQTDRRLQKLVRKASDRLHMKIPEVSLSWRRDRCVDCA